MSQTTLTSIDEHLLKSAGVGIAFIRMSNLELVYHNAAFADWFGDPAAEDGPSEALSFLRDEAGPALKEQRSYSGEVQVKPRRRMLVIDSYATVVKRNTRQSEQAKERVEKLLLNRTPRSVYAEFKTFGVVMLQLYRNASVLMRDFVGLLHSRRPMARRSLWAS